MSRNGRTESRALRLAVVMLGIGLASLHVSAQSCTSQARMSADVRGGLADAAFQLGSAVQAGAAAKVQASTVAEYAADFGGTAFLVRSTGAKLGGDALAVTQVYLLDARSRKAGDTSDEEFLCTLTGTTAETDFAISGLSPGMYGFAMVEATGPRPWLLAFLLRQDGTAWKMAGFYPRARTAAGHDGAWYWNAAWTAAKAKDAWLAWVLYGEADQLLRPANFATSTKLDSLRLQQRTVSPPELAPGVGTENPVVVKAEDGTSYRFIRIAAEGSDDGKRLNLVLGLQMDATPGAATDVTAVRAQSKAAAHALLTAHKDLRQGFDGVLVFAESAGHEPVASEQKMSEVP